MKKAGGTSGSAGEENETRKGFLEECEDRYRKMRKREEAEEEKGIVEALERMKEQEGRLHRPTGQVAWCIHHPASRPPLLPELEAWQRSHPV